MVKKNYNSRRKLSSKRISKRSRNSSMGKKVIIGVILLAFVAVVAFGVFAITYDEEKIVKSDLDKLATEYYEEFTYPGLVKGTDEQAEIEELMEMYLVRGFAAVHLRQLLLRDGRTKEVEEGLIEKHCDKNKTTVKFFPEAPYDKKSYRMEWRYDCDF